MPKLSLKAHGRRSTTTADDDEESDESSGFPLTVDLSGCVGASASCRVWARARLVRGLAARLRRAAGVRGGFVLLAGEDLLPPDEPLRLLSSTDTLRIARVEHEWQRPFSFTETDEDITPEEAEPTATVDSAQVVPQSTPSPPAYQPTAITNDDVTRRTSPPAVTKSRQRSPEETLQRVKRRALSLLHQVAGYAEPEREGDMPEREGADDVDAPKKRRRRVRRRRPARPLSLEPIPVEPPPVETSSPEPTAVTSPVTQSPPSPEPHACVRSPPVPAPVLVSCAPAPAPVLRAAPGQRAPRVVRALAKGADVILAADVTVGGNQ